MKADWRPVCPHCKRAANTIRSYIQEHNDETPDPGDYTICFHCGELAVFDELLMLREPTVDEYIVAGQDEEIADMRRAWMAYQEQVKNQPPDLSGINMLDLAFGNLEEGIVNMADAPPHAVVIMKTVYALGARSALCILDEERTPHEKAAMMAKYKTDIANYMDERARDFTGRTKQ